MTDKDKREGWTRNLKKGDGVVVNLGMYGVTIENVTGITPTGRIKVGNRSYDQYGSLIGDRGYARARLEELTEAIQVRICNERLINSVLSSVEGIKKTNDLYSLWQRLEKVDTNELRDHVNYFIKLRNSLLPPKEIL